MTPIVFINCTSAPFIDDIMSGHKVLETRTRNTLGRLAGRRVLIAETGNGRPVVRCSAIIGEALPIRSEEMWNNLYHLHRVPPGSRYDWKPGERVKYCYQLNDVWPCAAPFTPPEGVRHGRAWMEYDEERKA